MPAEVGNAAGLIIMGGPMSVYEQARYPHLVDELRLIEHALRDGIPILGVCLGSQLLAAALGARVHPGPQKEIGWYPIHLTEAAATDPLWANIDQSFVAYHWHGDVFERPHDAVTLASSDLTSCQGYRFGHNAYGLLFHLEVSAAMIADMVATFREEVQQAGSDGAQIVGRAATELPRLQRIAALVFHRWTNLL